MRKVRKRKKYDLYPVLTFVFGVTALCAVSGCFMIQAHYRNKEAKAEQEAVEAAVMAPVTYTQQEVDGAVETAVSQAVSRTTDDFLKKLREKMEEGESTVSVLRELYPDNIVIADKARYIFFDILDSVKKNSLSKENIKADEEKMLLEYVEDGNTVSKKGIDVSKYQGEIDWSAVKNDGVDYAFIRVGIRGYTTGEIVLDESFDTNIKGALQQGVDTGVYFFTQACSVEEAEQEADFVIQSISPYQVNYPVVIDVEDVASDSARTKDLTKEQRTEFVIAFCEKIKAAGYTPMIYGNLKTFMLMLDIEALEAYEKWYAYYSLEEFYYPYDFSIWQYTDKGKVAGIEKEVDMNVSFKEWRED